MANARVIANKPARLIHAARKLVQIRKMRRRNIERREVTPAFALMRRNHELHVITALAQALGKPHEAVREPALVLSAGFGMNHYALAVPAMHEARRRCYAVIQHRRTQRQIVPAEVCEALRHTARAVAEFDVM